MSKNSYERAELTGLPVSFFLNNRRRFIKRLKEILVDVPEKSFLFLMAGKELFKYDNDDDYHYFIQESNFYYLTGVREPGYYAMINLDDASFNLYIPQPSEREKVFLHWETLEQIAAKYACNTFDFVKIAPEISKLEPKKIYILNGTNSDSGLKILTCDYTFPEPYDSLNNLIDNDEKVYEVLADTRTVKSQEEIDLMQYLNDVTVEGHKQAMKKIYKNLKNNIIERDVENYFFSYTRFKLYSRNHPYEHICGCGPNSATLHYIDNDQVIKDGQLILMDMGVRAGGYVSDVTSTVPVNGTFTEKQKQIYNIVLEANKKVQELAKPGVHWIDMHLEAEKIILTGLKNLGLLNDFDVDEMRDKRVAYYFMPHGLGHLIGIDVHDVGGYLSWTDKRVELKGLDCLRSNRILEKGNVYSDEPGIYFVEFLLEKGFNDETIKKYFNIDKIKEYYDFGGVRIEDDLVITDNGCINLTANLPRTVEDIEKCMKED